MRSLVLSPCLLLSLLAPACREASTASNDDASHVVDASDPDTTPADAAPDAGPDFCAPSDTRVPVEIAATPEAGEAPYVDALMTATTKIRVEIYEMGYGGILDTLKAKAQAGVTVQVLLDQSKKSVNQKYFDQLTAAGAECKWSDPKFTYQHAKFFVVDDAVSVMSTGNYSFTYSISIERNFAVTDRDPADLADLIALFDADWHGVTPDMSCTRLVISPVNSKQRIVDVINSATTTLTIESMQFAETTVRSAVAARVAAGVEVRVMIADVGFVSANADAAEFLKGLGLEPKYIPHLHTKVIVADGARAYVGSENLSYTSLTKNREVGVITYDGSSIAPLSATFETDWAVGTDF